MVCSLELVRCTRVTILFHTYIIRLIIVHSSKLTYKHPFIHAYIFRYVYTYTYILMYVLLTYKYIYVCIFIYTGSLITQPANKQSNLCPPPCTYIHTYMQLKYKIFFSSPPLRLPNPSFPLFLLSRFNAFFFSLTVFTHDTLKRRRMKKTFI